MNRTPEHRRGPGRRRQLLGGRRPEDLDGVAPLVLLVGDDQSMVEKAEAILAKLRFAVTTSASVDEALRVLPELRPNIVVAAHEDEARIRSETQDVPFVVMRVPRPAFAIAVPTP